MEAAIALLVIIAFISVGRIEHKPPLSELNLATGNHQMLRTRQDVIPLSVTKDKHLLKQNYDYSCGSAALGTLLNGYLGENLTEEQIIQGMMKHGDNEAIKKLRAFSLWDMQQFLDIIGYKGAGYTAEPSDLENPDHWPCIVPIELYGYRHFVVVRGMYKNHVFVSDPWMGNSSYTMAQFLKMWHKNIMFIVFPNNGKSSHALTLKLEDLKIIDNKMAKHIIFPTDKPFTMPEEHQNWENVSLRPHDWSAPVHPVYYRPRYTRNGG